jgi:hypothetical protein
MAKPDAFATREQVVAFANMQLTEQIVPLIRQAIQRYDAEQRAARWYRRLGLWIARLFGWRMTPEQAADIIQNYPRDPEHQPEPEVVGEIRASGHPQDNGEVRRSCVVCGSVQLEPVNEMGGLRCANGHILEDPPTTAEPAPPSSDSGRGPAGSPGGPA